MKEILCVTEGHGDKAALPLLVDRWLQSRGWHRQFRAAATVIRASGAQSLKCPHLPQSRRGIEHWVQLAAKQGPSAILVVLDADDECATRPKEEALGPALLARARGVVGHIPIAVVVANRAFESWILADWQSLRDRAALPRGAWLGNFQLPEAEHTAKNCLAPLLAGGYHEPTHQLQFTAQLSLRPGMKKRSPSFAKLLRDLDRLVREARRRSA